MSASRSLENSLYTGGIMNRLVPKGSEPALARFNQLQVQRFTNDISKAIGHSNARNSRIVQAACFFSLIRSTAPNWAAMRVSVEAAQRKMFSSPGGYQAAHYLPGQLKISDQLPWSLLSSVSARQRLESLFADVEHLPAAFNKADSAAEDKGLRETFRSLGQAMLHDPLPGRTGLINRGLIRRVYDELWLPGATKSYSDAIAQKNLVNEVPALERDEEGNLLNLVERSAADWSREQEIDILQRYREALRTPPPSLQEGKILEIERTFA